VEDLTLPEGFLRLSDAVNLLAQGIWGGLQRPIPVQKFKWQYRKASVGFGPWKEKAGRCLRSAAIDGKVHVYVFGPPQSEIGDLSPEITPVPAAVLRRLIPMRGSLPDHPRASMKAAGGDGKLFRSLNTGLLLVRRSEFDSARHIFGDLFGDRVMDTILLALRQAGNGGMTRTEIFKLFGNNQTSSAISSALQRLAAHGKARLHTKITSGGRPTEIWRAT
jgi:hypothetical protein